MIQETLFPEIEEQSPTYTFSIKIMSINKKTEIISFTGTKEEAYKEARSIFFQKGQLTPDREEYTAFPYSILIKGKNTAIVITH